MPRSSTTQYRPVTTAATFPAVSQVNRATGIARYSQLDTNVLAINYAITHAVSHVVMLLIDTAYFQYQSSYFQYFKSKASSAYDKGDDSLLPISYAMGNWLMKTVFSTYQSLFPGNATKPKGFWLAHTENQKKLVAAVVRQMPEEWRQRRVTYYPGKNVSYAGMRSPALQDLELCYLGTHEAGPTKPVAGWVEELLERMLAHNFTPENTAELMNPDFFSRLIEDSNKRRERQRVA